LGDEVLPEKNPLPLNTRTLADDGIRSQTLVKNLSIEQLKENDQGFRGETTVTTEIRQPLKVPETVHVKITPENLKNYLGPPTYHKDRLYSTPPPPGVSTGLGYLGNGSGAVMLIEAVVRAIYCLNGFYLKH
jgi:ATP-dependent Lon protease